MPQCQKLRKRKRQFCVGDLRDRITIQNRSITPPSSGVDFDETFTNESEIDAVVNTVTGKTYFDDVGVGTNITHEIGFRFDETVTAESWILFNGRRLDILDLEDLDERHMWYRARCVDRGLVTKEASKT